MRLFMKQMSTYDIFSEAALYSASFESNFSFLRKFLFLVFFLFFIIFKQNLNTEIFLKFAQMQCNTTRAISEFTHEKKFEWF